MSIKSKTDLLTGIKKTYEYIKKRGPKEFDYDQINLEIKNSLTPKYWLKKEL